MRILHVAPIAGELGQGLSYSIPALAHAQSQTVHEVTLLTTGSSALLSNKWAFTLLWKGDLGKRPVPELNELIGQHDIVVIHSTYIPYHAVIAASAHRLGIPYILVPRGGMTNGAARIKSFKKAIGNALFFNRMVRRSRALHCLTENEASVSAYWGKRTFVAPNGIELTKFETTYQVNDPLRFLFIGRLSIFHKGLDLLLEAWATFTRAGHKDSAILDIYGPDENGSRKRLEGLIKLYEVSDTVNVRDPVYGAEKLKVLKSSNVFVHTSRFEGHPMAVLEALSVGLPCLLTPGTNVADSLEIEGAGIRVEESSDEIAEGLNQIICQQDTLISMSKKAREYAVANTWDKVAEKTLAQYEMILGTR